MATQKEVHIKAKDMKTNQQKELKDIKGEEIVIFPALFPIAYGDYIVFNQFVKFIMNNIHEFKPNVKSMVLTSLCRPEIIDLLHINDSIDYVVDLKVSDEESDRLKTLSIKLNGLHVVSIQEFVCRVAISMLMQGENQLQFYKMRYLPILPDLQCVRFRIWEERARLFLNEGKELPKLVPQIETKENIITVHFREAKYADPSRNCKLSQSQEIINRLKSEYSTYKICRLGDSSMTDLEGVDINLAKNGVSIEAQIEYVQKSKLFIGCHSAPQHLVVACSDTPVICINYTANESCDDMGDNIARMSYEPVGKQVKKIFYNKMQDKDFKELIPNQNRRDVYTVTETNVDELMAYIKDNIEL
jgi:hypothetical protein